jgi:CheY-like chemotaxis protein
MDKGKKPIRKRRILLVDDDLDMRELVKSILDANVHEIVEANNGAEAIVLVAYRRFDLVMTDYKMPLVNGSELAVAIKELVPSQPILMLTGYGNALRQPNPVDAVVRKPFSVEHLRATVAKILSASDHTTT